MATGASRWSGTIPMETLTTPCSAGPPSGVTVYGIWRASVFTSLASPVQTSLTSMLETPRPAARGSF